MNVAPTLAEQSVIVHLFAPLTGPDATDAHAQVRRLWRRCATELGMVDGIPAAGVPTDPSGPHARSSTSSLRAEPVAARQRAADGIRQAVWLHDNDVACVSVALSAPGWSWDDLHTMWQAATDQIAMDTLLGVVEEFVGLVAGTDTVTADSDIPADVRGQLPAWMVGGTHVDPTWTNRGVTTRAGYGIWQPTTPTAGSKTRRLLILTTPSRDAALSNFVWNAGPEPDLAPLTAYLIDAARLAYEVEVWQDAGRHDDLKRHAETALHDSKRAMHALAAGHASPADLDAARHHLGALQLIEANFAEAASRLAQLQATVRALAENLIDHTTRYLTTAVEDADADNGFAHDRRVAVWFERQLRHDADILATVRDEIHHRVNGAANLAIAHPVPAPRVIGPDEATTVVLTAIDVEQRAIRDHLNDVVITERGGTLYQWGRLPDTPARVVVTQLGVGNISAAVLTERTIAALRPTTVIFAGIAGALHDDLALGDVVVATWIYAYHSGTEQHGRFLARPRAWPATHHLLQRARHVASALAWPATALTSAGRPPRVVFRPVASGEVVVDGQNSPTMSQLRRHYDDAAAIEMESAGAAEAAYLNGAVPILTVRAISDHADGRKTTTDAAGWQTVAATNAATFTCALIAAL
jgi:nucleoside phosphorylase